MTFINVTRNSTQGQGAKTPDGLSPSLPSEPQSSIRQIKSQATGVLNPFLSSHKETTEWGK